MNSEHQNQPAKQAEPQADADARLWDVLGQTTQPRPPADFLEKVMQGVEDLEHARASTTAASPREQLAAAWRGLQEAMTAMGEAMSLRGGLVAAFAVVALFTGAILLPQLAQQSSGGAGSPTAYQGKGSPLPKGSGAPSELYAMNDVEVQTILRLDDHLAFVDQQVWLDSADSGMFD